MGVPPMIVAGILPVSITGASACSGRARMALRLMGGTPMLRKKIVARARVVAEDFQGAVQAGLDRAGRDVESRSNFVETHVVEETHEDHLALVFG